MPFITSKIYSNLVNYDDKALMTSHWPKTRQRVNYDEKNDFIETMKDIIVEIRNIRAKMNVHPSKKVELIFVTTKYEKEIEKAKEFITKLGFGSNLKIQRDKTGIAENAVSIVRDGIELYMPLEGLVDLEEEAKRKAEEIEKIKFEIERAEKILSNPGFVNKAPQAKIDEEKAKLEKYKEMLNKLQ